MQIKYNTDDLRICGIAEVIPPAQVHDEMPISERAAQTTLQARNEIHKLLAGQDDRLLVVVGPCSIHDPVAAHDYANRLKVLSEKVKDTLYLVMRVYFEKPRTTVGWKGLINDPDMNDSFNIEKGLHIGRGLLLELNEKVCHVQPKHLIQILHNIIKT